MVNEYLKQVNKRFSAGNSTEHSYRADLQNLLLELVNGINVTNEPKHQECGAPDYIIQKKQVPLGYIEAKDIDADLDKVEKSEQLKRYLASLDNLILTNYIEFRFYQYSQKVKTIVIGEIDNKKIKPVTESIDSFTTHIKDFCSFKGQTIKSAEKLAKMMANKAKMMEGVILNVVKDTNDDSSLKDQLNAFKKILIHDLDEKTFADIYAQTIAYGLFAARLHDTTLEDFSRQEARELIPKSNPFLRNLFDYISGAQLEERVVWIVNDLADIYRATDIKALLNDFGKSTGQTDPFIHFYETFLAEYDPKLRKSRGVYYTPEPVVNFIVRAVDDILKSEFGIKEGLSDTSKVKISQSTGTSITKGKHKGREAFEDVMVHKVQILDPASGTGTFLAEVVKQIYKKFEGQAGVWSNYVEEHLLPRLNGFEILMAPYTMCHLKLDMLLHETGYKPKSQERLRVFLTNSLEEVHPDTGTLFITWLSNEASEANTVKRDTPVMVVLGNPPYANFGQMNQGEWIKGLIADYKKNLNEKKINIDDDYVKFIRYGHYMVEKNGEGILAYISNNSFIDGITHRQMRKHLLETFDKIYILDLHGSTKKLETAEDGSKDENVFDIQQGVSINIFIKRKIKKLNASLYHYDIYGLRDNKYKMLFKNKISSIKWNKIDYKEPYYFFVPKNFAAEESYKTGFSVSDVFLISGSGVKNERDDICKQFTKSEMVEVVNDFINLDAETIKSKYKVKDTRDWKVNNAQEDVLNNRRETYYRLNLYRPFDKRFTYYTGTTRGFIGTPGSKRMYHLIDKDNVSLLTCRQQSTFDFQHAFVSHEMSDICVLSSQTKETGYVFPLYLYPDNTGQGTIDDKTREPNFNNEIINKLVSKLGLTFTPEKENTNGTLAPIDLLDYIYAILHSPSYREKFKEFLKIEFPRIPYPEEKETFWKLVKLGGELRTIHLLENPIVEKPITKYPVSGENIVEKPEYKDGKVYINGQQYFDKVPEIAWEFYIGGYQPAQKWLKDRKGRKLNYDDIKHYQKIIVALAETNRIMKEIDEAIKL